MPRAAASWQVLLFRVFERISHVCNSTNGMDKVLKLAQYVLRVPHLRLLDGGDVKNAATRSHISTHISLARALFRVGRSFHNLHWIRLILAGDGDRTPFVVFFRLLGYTSNGFWFICDHSRWWYAIRGLSPMKDPLVPLNRACAVVQQGSLVMLNLRNVVIVLREVWRTLYDAEANRRARGLLLAIIPHVVKNFADLIGQWNFGLQLGASDSVLNWAAIVASISGLYIEVSRAKLREQIAQKNVRRANPRAMAKREMALREATPHAAASSAASSEDESGKDSGKDGMLPLSSTAAAAAAAVAKRRGGRRPGAGTPRRSPLAIAASDAADAAAAAAAADSTGAAAATSTAVDATPRKQPTQKKHGRRSSMVLSAKQMRRIASNALDHRGGSMFAQIPDGFEGIRLVFADDSAKKKEKAQKDAALFGY